MKKLLYLSLGTLLFTVQQLKAQVNLVVEPDSVYVALPATENEISLTSHITNNTGDTVVIRWTRVVEQETPGWGHAFCDKNTCYFGTVASKTFDLWIGETGILKPVFYPNGILGTGVMRLYYQSETPGVVWNKTAVYVAVGEELLDAVEAVLVKDVVVFPSPAKDNLNVVSAEAGLQGQWHITDVAGKTWKSSGADNSVIGGQISIAALPAGLYFLNIKPTDGKLAVVKRFVVQR